jgi:PLP dependent protein
VSAPILLQSPLEENLLAVRSRLDLAARSCGRSPEEVELLPITKSVTTEVAADLVRLGMKRLGENRADELERKAAAFNVLGLEVEWHFVGHIQRNKARRIVRLADVIHSVDSLELLETLDRVAGEEARRPRLFLQVDLTGETSKGGLDPEELLACARAAARLRHVEVIGVMAMAALAPTAESAPLPLFTRAAELARSLPGFESAAPLLSMGMSGDFEDAVRAGSQLVRVGSALYRGVTA